jgi:hypothetical protein
MALVLAAAHLPFAGTVAGLSGMWAEFKGHPANSTTGKRKAIESLSG